MTALARGQSVLGRDGDCDIVLDGALVSRRHAAMRREGAALFVQDLGSRNGVFVDGVRIQGEARLFPGTLLRIGDHLGRVVQVSPAEARDPEPFRLVGPGYLAGPVLWPRLAPLERAARFDLPIVLVGETGTGKEGAARAAHAWSGRSGAFVAVNASAVPETLAEAELFGYRRGAFTGADRASSGFLRAADGGTLFLDEIVDLPAVVQPKLLRALEQREVVPLGETAPMRIDVRLVVACQRPLPEAVEAGKLRPDLAARLDGLTVTLPPLRERVEEVPALFVRLLERGAAGRPVPACDVGLIEALCLYAWPANIRELDLLARQLLALHADQPLLTRAHLPAHLVRTANAAAMAPSAFGRDRPRPSSAEVRAQLEHHRGNVKYVAQALGISRQRLYRLVQEWGMDVNTFRGTPASPVTDADEPEH